MEVVISKSEGVRGNKGKYSYTSDTGEFRPRMSNSALVFLKRVLSREHMLPQMLPLTDRYIITYCKLLIKIRIPPFMITGGALESTGRAQFSSMWRGIYAPSRTTVSTTVPHKTIFQNFMKGYLMPPEQNLETSKSMLGAQTLRSEISVIVSDMYKLHGKTTRAIRSAARSYQSLIEHEKSIFRIGDDAADWPDDVFRYRKPGEASRHFAICCFATEFQLASRSLLAAPNFKKYQDGSAFEGAFKNFKYLQDSWEYPERFTEVAPEDIEYVAATEADFGEDA